MTLTPQEQEELLQLLSEKHGKPKEMPTLAEMPKEKSIGDFLSGFPAYVAGDLGNKAGALGAGVVGAARSVPFAEKAAAGVSSLINDSSYGQERDIQKAVLGSIEKKHPTASGVGQIGGMVANPISKLGLLPQAALYGASSTDINPIESPSAAAGQMAANTATNMVLPIALKGAGALGRNLSDTRIGRPVTKAVEKTAGKLGGYVSPEKLRVAEMLKKNLSPNDLKEAENVASQAAKYGGVNLPAGVTGGENLAGYAKVASSQPYASSDLTDAMKNITNIIGRSTKNKGEVVKGSMGEQVSKMYDTLKPVTIDKAGFARLLRDNQGAAKYINQAIKESEALATGVKPNSLEIIKNARDLMNKDNLSTGAYESVKKQFNNIAGNSFNQADEAFKVLSDIRLKSGAVRNQINKTTQKARGQTFVDTELSKAAKGTLKTIGLAGRAAGAVIGISSQRLENLLASNPRAQKELVRLLLKVPAKDLAKELNVQPTVLNKLVDRLKTSGAIGLTEQMRNK